MISVIVTVYPKSEILDPQSKAVFNALIRQGLDGMLDVRQGKQFTLTFSEAINAETLKKIRFLVETLLSNPVIEDFSMEVKNET